MSTINIDIEIDTESVIKDYPSSSSKSNPYDLGSKYLIYSNEVVGGDIVSFILISIDATPPPVISIYGFETQGNPIATITTEDNRLNCIIQEKVSGTEDIIIQFSFSYNSATYYCSTGDPRLQVSQ